MAVWLFRYFRVSPRIFPAACRFDQFDLLFPISRRTTAVAVTYTVVAITLGTFRKINYTKNSFPVLDIFQKQRFQKYNQASHRLHIIIHTC